MFQVPMFTRSDLCRSAEKSHKSPVILSPVVLIFPFLFHHSAYGAESFQSRALPKSTLIQQNNPPEQAQERNTPAITNS